MPCNVVRTFSSCFLAWLIISVYNERCIEVFQERSPSGVSGYDCKCVPKPGKEPPFTSSLKSCILGRPLLRPIITCPALGNYYSSLFLLGSLGRKRPEEIPPCRKTPLQVEYLWLVGWSQTTVSQGVTSHGMFVYALGKPSRCAVPPSS